MRKTHALTAKLKSRAGVSMVIALIFLLLCAMVGVLVLSAASVSAGKLSRERQYYRQTLALTSAARLLSNQVQGMTFVGSYVQTETVITTITGSGDNLSTKVEESTSYSKALPTLSDTAFLDSLKEKLDILFQSQNPAKGESTMTIPESTAIVFQANETQKIPEVKGEMTLDKEYSIKVVLTCEDNSMTLVFRAQCADSTKADAPKVETSSDEKTTKTTLTTYSTTITWGAPTITEGGDAA